MLDERTGFALQTRDESCSTVSTGSSTKSSTLFYSGANFWRMLGFTRLISVLAALSVVTFFSACTDYESMIEDEYEAWLSAQTNPVPTSSDSFIPNSSSASVVDPSETTVVNPLSVVIGSMTDTRNEGATYKTVTIGSQTWMAQNLNYETEANSYCYDNNVSNCAKYGRLYSWKAATSACPAGWHLPTAMEFGALFNLVGGLPTAGKMLKMTISWNKNGNGTDAYSFDALPAGYRFNTGLYNNEGDNAYFWSATEYNTYRAYSMVLSSGSEEAEWIDENKALAYSVRCVKD